MTPVRDLVNPRAIQTATLVDALVVLRELANDAQNGSHTAGIEPANAVNLGRFIEACDLAGDVLFNVLNVGASHIEHPRYVQALEHYRTRQARRCL